MSKKLLDELKLYHVLNAELQCIYVMPTEFVTMTWDAVVYRFRI